MRIRDILVARDWKALAEAIEKRYRVKVDPKDLELECFDKSIPQRHRDGVDWQESTFWMWIKNRMDALGVQTAQRYGAPDMTEFVSCVLHVFFVYVEETELQLAMLRQDLAEIKACVARSKISKTNEVIRPIDRVALRVAPPPDQEGG